MTESLTLFVLFLTLLAVVLLLHSFRSLRSQAGVLIVLYTVFMISFLFHAPFTQSPLGLWGFKYNDVVYGVFSPRFSTDLMNNKEKLVRYWLRPESFEELVSGTNLCPVPYVDYKFEYPPLVGFFWFLTTCVSFSISGGLPRQGTSFSACLRQ